MNTQFNSSGEREREREGEREREREIPLFEVDYSSMY